MSYLFTTLNTIVIVKLLERSFKMLFSRDNFGTNLGWNTLNSLPLTITCIVWYVVYDLNILSAFKIPDPKPTYILTRFFAKNFGTGAAISTS